MCKNWLTGRIFPALFAGLLAFCAAALFIACPTEEKDDGADKASLEAAITAAEALKADVTVSADGVGLADGAAYAPQADYDTFDSAITAAKTVFNNTKATQEQVDIMVSLLEAAKIIFEGKIKIVGGVNKTGLSAAINTAETLKAGVEISADGAGLAAGTRYASAENHEVFSLGIDAAKIVLNNEAATQSDVDLAKSALEGVQSVFEGTIHTVPGGEPISMYPEPGSANAYTDGELMIKFDDVPVLADTGSVSIHNKSTGAEVDKINFAGEKQVFLGSSNNNLNVGSQLVRIDGNSVFITPHFGKLQNGTEYYVVIPDGAITAAFGGAAFAGLADNKDSPAWSFTTRTAAPALNASAPISVDGSLSSTANFKTLYGALYAIAGQAGEWTIDIAPGTYHELIHYVTSAAQTITINGTGTAEYGKDVVIQYANAEQVNSGSHARASFYVSGPNLVLKNITVKNTIARAAGYDPGQAEAIYFANGTGKTLAAYNCSFLSHQDTIQTTGKNWFYKCYIEGDTDYIWGTADACLLEECQLVSVYDENKSNRESVLLVARTGNTADTATTVPKGYVIFKSKVKVDTNMKVWFGRNAGAGSYYDQAAIVDTAFTTETGGSIDATVWRGATYTPLAKREKHVGWKDYNNTLNGEPMPVSGRLANTNAIDQEYYNFEYNGRRTILNRVYQKSKNYANAASPWDISALETAFNAAPDASKDNNYADAPVEPPDPYSAIESVAITPADTVTIEAGKYKGLTTALTPADATDPVYAWEIIPGTGTGSIYGDANTPYVIIKGLTAGSITVKVTVTTTNPETSTPAAQSAQKEITITAAGEQPEFVYQWDKSTTDEFALSNTTPRLVADKNWTRLSGTVTVTAADGIKAFNNGRFMIGSQSTVATDASTFDINGEFDFTKKAILQIEYSDVKGQNFQVFLNNNTTSSGSSVFGSKSRLYSGAPSGPSPLEITIDPATLGDHPSLATAFLGIRAESGATITISKISIKYVD